MSADTKFINGLIIKAPNEKAPEYVKARISIRREELIEWLKSEQGEWINADIKVSQGGKWYAAVDDWKPENGRQRSNSSSSNNPKRTSPASPVDDFEDDDLPF